LLKASMVGGAGGAQMEDRRRRDLNVTHGAMIGSWLDGQFDDAATACRLLARYFDELAERPQTSGVVVQVFPRNGLGAGRAMSPMTPAPVTRGLEERA
jgi:hypothetical protein